MKLVLAEKPSVAQSLARLDAWGTFGLPLHRNY